MMADAEDWTLVQRAAGGDMNAFTQLVQRYQKPIVRFCYRMTGSQPDAEDIAQETFVRLYNVLHRLRPEHSFSTALFTIARNRTLNHLRGAGRHHRKIVAFAQTHGAFMSTSKSPDRAAQAGDIGAALETALAGLPEKYREALVLRECEGFNYQQIGAILLCPVGTVRSRIARAREQVRQHLLRYGENAL